MGSFKAHGPRDFSALIPGSAPGPFSRIIFRRPRTIVPADSDPGVAVKYRPALIRTTRGVARIRRRCPREIRDVVTRSRPPARTGAAAGPGPIRGGGMLRGNQPLIAVGIWLARGLGRRALDGCLPARRGLDAERRRQHSHAGAWERALGLASPSDSRARAAERHRSTPKWGFDNAFNDVARTWKRAPRQDYRAVDRLERPRGSH
jgi:hypothetical protein